MLRMDLAFEKHKSLQIRILFQKKEKYRKTKSHHPSNRNVKHRCKSVCVRQTILFYLLTHTSLVFFIIQITNKQRHYDKASNGEQFTANAPRSETFIHLTEASHGICTFYSYHVKLNFYLKLCLWLGSWSQKNPSFKMVVVIYCG